MVVFLHTKKTFKSIFFAKSEIRYIVEPSKICNPLNLLVVYRLIDDIDNLDLSRKSLAKYANTSYKGTKRKNERI